MNWVRPEIWSSPKRGTLVRSSLVRRFFFVDVTASLDFTEIFPRSHACFPGLHLKERLGGQGGTYSLAW